jgi:hypothetical protein
MRPRSHVSHGMLFLAILVALVLAVTDLYATPDASGGPGAGPVSASAMNGPPGLLAGSWPAMRGPYGTGLSPFKGPEKPKEKWVVNVGDCECQTPLIAADGTIYTFMASRQYIAVNAVSPEGKVKWKIRVSAVFPRKAVMIYVNPCLTAEGTIYLHAWDKLCAISPDGQVKWKTDTGTVDVSFGLLGAQVAGPAVSRDGTAYLAASTQQLLAVGPDGAVKWTAALTGAPRGSPVVSPDGTVYVAARSGKQYLVTAFTPSGEPKWQVPFPNEYLQSLTVDQRGVLYVVLNNTCSVYAVGPDGVVRWKWVVPGTPRRWEQRKEYLDGYPPIIDEDGILYIGTHGMMIASVNPDGSAGRTVRALDYLDYYEGMISSSVVDSAGVRYLTTTPETFMEKFRADFLVSVDSGKRGKLCAFALNGEKKREDTKWTVSGLTHSAWGACPPAIGADGTMYVTSRGHVIAIGEDKP